MGMAQLVAVEGCTIELSSGQAASVKIEGTYADKVKVNNSRVFKGKVSVTISGFQGVSIIDGNGTGSGDIQGSSEKCNAGGETLVLKGDSVSVTLSGTKTIAPSPPSPATETITISVKEVVQNVVNAT